MNRTRRVSSPFLRTALAGLITLGLAAPLTGCKKGRASEKNSASGSVVPVEVEPLTPVSHQRRALAVATAEPWRQVTLRAEAAGRILSLKKDVGASVKRSTLLARLDGSVSWRSYQTARVTIKQARVSLNKARIDLQRAKRLRKSDDYSQAQLDQAQSAYDSASAALKLARAQTAQAGQQLSNYALRAPFAGTISQRPLEVGDYVSPGSALYTLVDASKLKVVVGLNPKDGLILKAGASAAVSVETATGTTRRAARVHLVRPVVDSTTRRVEVELAVDNADGKLKPGMIVDVEIPVGKPRDLLLVPQGAVVERTGQQFIFVVRGGRAVRLAVTTGVLTASRVEIKPGKQTALLKDDRLVVLGLQRLVPGTKVTISRQRKGAQPTTQPTPSR